jgi:alpha/beta superfamily hydrolase
MNLPAPGETQTRLLEGAAGAVEALLTAPATPPRGVAVVCHPHPLFGGAMSNKVVHTLAGSAQKAGLATLRFNFRGVGRSAGRHDEGRGETEDTVRLARWFQAQYPGAPLLLAGFSFGAFIILRAAAELRPRALISVAPPLGKYVELPRPEHPQAPWLLLHGTADDVVPYAETRAALADYQPPPQLVSLEDAGHFFHGRLGDLQDAVKPFLDEHFA